MLSFRLWRALKRPPTRNPVFRRAYVRPEEPAPWYVGCVQWAGVLIFLPIIALAGLIYGAGWSVGIAGLLGRERENRSFDLLALTPPGPLGMSWATALGYLYAHSTFRNVNQTGNLLARATLMAAILSSAGLVLSVSVIFSAPPLTLLALYAAALFVALLADQAQSLVAAVLVGILAADAAGSRLGAQLYAFALYAGIQLVTYIVTFALGFTLLPVFADAMGEIRLLESLAVVGWRLVLFAGSRELLIWLLWRRIDATLCPDPYELRILLGQPARKRGI